jgi:hypothetical protein
MSTRTRRRGHIFFLHFGTLVLIVTYFVALGPPPFQPDAVRRALRVGLVASSAYIAIARRRGELKQFDIGVWLMFAAGVLGSLGSGPLIPLFQHYSPAVVPATLGFTALVPMLIGREPFTVHFARDTTPAWQMRTAEFPAIIRAVSAWWVAVFFSAAALAAWDPLDWHFTTLYPNLVIVVLGLSAALWLPPLYLKLFPPGLPTHIEPLVMGMPLVFDKRAAGDTRACIQFRVSGEDPADYHLRIERGRCRSFEGAADAPDLTVHTPGPVWLQIARGELDGTRALMDGLYRVEGNLDILVKMQEWFPVRR